MVGGYDEDLPQSQQEDAIRKDPNPSSPALALPLSFLKQHTMRHNAMQLHAIEFLLSWKFKRLPLHAQ